MVIHLEDGAIHKAYYHDIKKSPEETPFARFLGMNLTELGLETATAVLIPTQYMLNSHRAVHGAVIYALADYAFEAASNS